MAVIVAFQKDLCCDGLFYSCTLIEYYTFVLAPAASEKCQYHGFAYFWTLVLLMAIQPANPWSVLPAIPRKICSWEGRHWSCSMMQSRFPISKQQPLVVARDRFFTAKIDAHTGSGWQKRVFFRKVILLYRQFIQVEEKLHYVYIFYILLQNVILLVL